MTQHNAELTCGSCVRACPQGAKSVRDDRALVREAMASGRTVVASVAPSAPAYFGLRLFAQMEQALRALGFGAGHETAFGLIPHIAPVVSPMIAHGRWLRERYGAGACLVFIGPCFAKKGEIHDEPVRGTIDAALTYEELSEWLGTIGVSVPAPPDEHERIPRANARAFPVEGGLVSTAINPNQVADVIRGESMRMPYVKELARQLERRNKSVTLQRI